MPTLAYALAFDALLCHVTHKVIKYNPGLREIDRFPSLEEFPLIVGSAVSSSKMIPPIGFHVPLATGVTPCEITQPV